MEQGDFSIGAIIDYARQPLVLEISSGDGSDPTRVPIIDHLLALDLSVSIAAHDYLRFSVAAPFFGFSVDQDGELLGPTIGDVRLSAVGLIIRPEHITTGGGFGLGLEAHGDLPTGNEERFVARGGFGGGGGVIATYEASWFTASASVGVQFDPDSVPAPNWTGDDALETGVGFGFGVSQASAFHIEGRRSTAFTASAVKGSSSPAELIASYRYRGHDGLFMVIGLGAGLSEGVGSARYRAFLGLGWGNMDDRRPPDSDAYGQFTATDACPAEPEVYNDYADDDGCFDELGQVAVQAVKDGVVVDGATVEIRGDNVEPQAYLTSTEPVYIADVIPGGGAFAKATLGSCLAGESSIIVSPGENTLAVPMVPMHPAKVSVQVWNADGEPIPAANVFWRVEDRNCAPPMATSADEQGIMSTTIGIGPAHLLVTAAEYLDHDADYTFARGDDRTINVTLNPVKKKVVRVRLEKKRIVILEKVHFEFNKAIIQPDSFPLLNDVAATIIDNPQVGRVEVSGHTDSKGSDSYNQTLSQDRAAAVGEYLVGRGVDPARVLSVGYGESTPIADNETEVGREENRRVEFNLIDQTDEPQFEEVDMEVEPGAPTPEGANP